MSRRILLNVSFLIILVSGGLALVSSHAADPQGPTQATNDKKETSVANGQAAEKLPIIGAEEYVVVDPEGKSILLKARIDSGANTSSLWAENILRFERDGAPWVRFELPLSDEEGGKRATFERKVERTVEIKRKNAENQSRVAVWMLVRFGEFDEKLQFTLADRSGFDFPLLLGRNFLHGNFLIDVSRKYTIPKDTYTNGQ